jgi:hypothetical protein
MENSLNFYFSINDFFNEDILDLIKNNIYNIHEEYSTLLWGNNNNIVGNIIYELDEEEEKNQENNNNNNDCEYKFYTYGIIKIIINNLYNNENIRFEISLFENGNKINIFTNSYNKIINNCFINDVLIINKFEINIEPFINQNEKNGLQFYSILSIKKLIENI